MANLKQTLKVERDTIVQGALHIDWRNSKLTVTGVLSKLDGTEHTNVKEEIYVFRHTQFDKAMAYLLPDNDSLTWANPSKTLSAKLLNLVKMKLEKDLKLPKGDLSEDVFDLPPDDIMDVDDGGGPPLP